MTVAGVAAAGEDLGDAVVYLLPGAVKVPSRRRDVGVVHDGEAAEEERHDSNGGASPAGIEWRHGGGGNGDGVDCFAVYFVEARKRGMAT